MFFFFEEENDSKISGLAFETYVINAMQKYIESQGKTLICNIADSAFDAYLPDGIDDINEPMNIEIKYYSTEKKNAYFQQLYGITDKVNRAEENSMLLILGEVFSEKSINSMLNLIQGRTNKKIYIWDLSVFNEKTACFRESNFEDIKNHGSVLVDAALNDKASDDEFKSTQKRIIDSLKSKYKNEEIALFLGAGISIDSGIPQWSELINKLLAKMIKTKLNENNMSEEVLGRIINLACENRDDSPIMEMRYIRNAFEKEEYNELVHDALYSKKPNIKTNLLKAISAICKPSRNHIGVQGIITYNFDNLLERRMKKDGVLTNAIYDENGYSVSDKLSIYHVHGFLPQNTKEDSSHELIFSEEDYHRVYRDAYCWSNIVQLNYLREQSCLFIGCSLTDPNLRRLLDVAARRDEKPRHFALIKKPQIKKQVGITKDEVNTYRKIEMSIKEKNMAAMGINIIWLDDFKEIKNILESLKN